MISHLPPAWWARFDSLGDCVIACTRFLYYCAFAWADSPHKRSVTWSLLSSLLLAQKYCCNSHQVADKFRCHWAPVRSLWYNTQSNVHTHAFLCIYILVKHVSFVTDLRECSLSTCVPREEIQRKSKEWKVAAYFETSAMFNIGLFVAVKQCVCNSYTSCLFTLAIHVLVQIFSTYLSLLLFHKLSPSLPMNNVYQFVRPDSSHLFRYIAC